MEPKRNCICIAVFLIVVFPMSSTMDCFNGIHEADFLCAGEKFENVDLETFVAEKNGPSGVMIFASTYFTELGIPLVLIPNFPLPLSISSAIIGTLRC